MTEDSGDFVTQAAWRRPAGRRDAIDEIADQFERPGASEFWHRAAAHTWTPPASGWVERRAS